MQGTNEASRIGILEIAGNATVESTVRARPGLCLAWQVRSPCARCDGRRMGRCRITRRTLTPPPTQAAYIKQPATTLPQLRRILYDQYEASFPLTVAGDCFEAVLQTAYGDDLLGADPAKRWARLKPAAAGLARRAATAHVSSTCSTATHPLPH